MKKITAILIAILLVLSAAACGETKADPKKEDQGQSQTQGNETAGDEGKTDIKAEIKDPVLNWWRTDDYGTGIRSVTLEFTNPNTVPVDVDFNIRFFSGGEQVGYAESYYINCFGAGTETICWGNWEIPQADRIEIEWNCVAESVYEPKEVKIVKEEDRGNGVYVAFEPAEDYSVLETYTVFTKGGTPVLVWLFSAYPGLETDVFMEPLCDYDGYRIYVSAY